MSNYTGLFPFPGHIPARYIWLQILCQFSALSFTPPPQEKNSPILESCLALNDFLGQQSVTKVTLQFLRPDQKPFRLYLCLPECFSGSPELPRRNFIALDHHIGKTTSQELFPNPAQPSSHPTKVPDLICLLLQTGLIFQLKAGLFKGSASELQGTITQLGPMKISDLQDREI